MERFSKFYYLNEDLPIIRSFLNIFRTKKKVGVNPNWLTILKGIDQKTYITFLKKLSSLVQKKTKLGKDKVSVEEIKQGDIGKIKDKTLEIVGDIAIDKETIKKFPYHVPVYELTNGGKFILFSLPKENAESEMDRIYAFGMDKKANKIFEDIFGMTFKDYMLVSGDDISKTLDIDKKRKDVDIDDKVKEVPSDEKKDEEIVIMEILPETAEMIINKMWKTKVYKDETKYGYEGEYIRQKYDDPYSEKAFKYSFKDKSGSIILLKNKDNAILHFSDEPTFKKAKTLGMLDSWIGHKKPIIVPKKRFDLDW